MVNKFTGNIALLWMIALTSAVALAGPDAEGDRSGGREERREQRQGARPDGRESQQYLPQMQSAPPPQPQPVQPAQPNLQPQGQPAPPDAGRRQGKMSAEERRALRQQIDQASHELYPLSR